MTTIAMMQMRVQPNELKRNLWHMRELLSLVGDADVALFPECCDLGWAADSAAEQVGTYPRGEYISENKRYGGRLRYRYHRRNHGT
mgnify:FL=1